MTDIGEIFSLTAKLVDAELDRLLPGEDVEPWKLHRAIRWSVFAGGKRIRPTLLLAAIQMFCGDLRKGVTAAAALEMLHTYSLIHDDLPSMDDDDLRRGQQTVHKKFDEATAILAGDVLQTLAFRSIVEDAGLSAETRIEIVGLLARAAGTPDGMVAGQQLDLDAEGEILTITQIEHIHKLKTGALIAASVEAGAVIAGADEADRSNIRVFGEHLGLLFQITDDLIDVTGATESIGKTAGKDATVQKSTFPSIVGLAGTRAAAAAAAASARTAISRLKGDGKTLTEIVDMVENRSS